MPSIGLWERQQLTSVICLFIVTSQDWTNKISRTLNITRKPCGGIVAAQTKCIRQFIIGSLFHPSVGSKHPILIHIFDTCHEQNCGKCGEIVDDIATWREEEQSENRRLEETNAAWSHKILLFFLLIPLVTGICEMSNSSTWGHSFVLAVVVLYSVASSGPIQFSSLEPYLANAYCYVCSA